MKILSIIVMILSIVSSQCYAGIEVGVQEVDSGTPTEIVTFITQNASVSLYGTACSGQSFTLAQNETLYSITIYCTFRGTEPDMYIRVDDDQDMSSEYIAEVHATPSTTGEYEYVFSSLPTLPVGTIYFVIKNASTTYANRLGLSIDSAHNYTGGVEQTGTDWVVSNNTGWDMYFRIKVLR